MELEDFIQQHVQAGQFTDHGVFTVSLEKMLEKLAQYQGRDKFWWLPRVIQAAVAARAGSVHLKRLRDFHFQPEETWTLDGVHSALLDPQLVVSRSLEHLRRALWSASWQQGLPFELRLKGDSQALVGLKGLLTRRPSDGLDTCLTIGFGEDQLGGPRSDRLKTCAHCCPLPLLAPLEIGVIGRIDALELGRRAPVALGFLPGTLPQLQIPTATGTQGEQFYQLRLPADQPPLYAVGFSLDGQGDNTLHWVDDGVVVDCEPIFPARNQGLRVWAYASAEGLARDASGYRLIQSLEREQRLQQVLQILVEGLVQLPPPERLWKASWLGPNQASAAVMGLTWLGGWLCGDPIMGFLASGFTGTATRFMAQLDQTETGARERCNQDARDLESLKSELRQWQAASSGG